jgi:hypothetical protein
MLQLVAGTIACRSNQALTPALTPPPACRQKLALTRGVRATLFRLIKVLSPRTNHHPAAKTYCYSTKKSLTRFSGFSSEPTVPYKKNDLQK